LKRKRYKSWTIFLAAFTFFLIIVFPPVIVVIIELLKLKASSILSIGLVEPYKNSLIIASTSSLFSLMISLPLGLIFGSRSFRHPYLFIVILLIPLIVPPYLTAKSWIDLFVKTPIGGPLFCGVILSLCYFPIPLYLIVSGLRRIDSELEESALLILNRWQILTKITIPLIYPYIATGLILIFLFSITNYSVPSILGIKCLITKLYSDFSIFHNLSKSIWIAIPMIIICLFLSYLLGILIMEREFISFDISPSKGIMVSIFENHKKVVYGIVIIFLIILFPLISLFKEITSLKILAITFKDSLRSFFHTIVLSTSGSLFLSIISICCGYMFQRKKFWKNRLLNAIILFPFSLPSVLLAICITHIWNRAIFSILYDTPLILIILWGSKYLPLTIRIISDHVSQIPVEFEEAGLLSHLTQFKVFRHIVCPLLGSGFLLIFWLIYILTISEVGGTLLVIPPGIETLSIRIFNLLHYGDLKVVASTSIMLILSLLIPISFLLILKTIQTLKGKDSGSIFRKDK